MGYIPNIIKLVIKHKLGTRGILTVRLGSSIILEKMEHEEFVLPNHTQRSGESIGTVTNDGIATSTSTLTGTNLENSQG